MKNKFYGIGVGPGDPELITLKAYRVLKETDIIFAPKARIKSRSLSGSIAEKILDEKKEFIEVEFPMTKDSDVLRQRYLKTARLILDKIEEGNQVAFLTIGDPMLYSTYIYLLNALKESDPALVIETIPGIPAYSALAARSCFSLAEKEERFSICAVPKEMDDLKDIILKNDTIVIMKVAKRLHEVINLLKEMDLLKSTVFGSHVGQDNEKLIDGRSNEAFDVSEKESYLSTIIVRTNKV